MTKLELEVLRLQEAGCSTIKALSIRQPWAWLILWAGKDIENRSRRFNFRGRFLVHASSGMTRNEYLAAMLFLQQRGLPVPEGLVFEDLKRGGIVGSVELIDCFETSESPWYMMGQKALVLNDSEPLPFIPCTGRLGLFDVPLSLIA